MAVNYVQFHPDSNAANDLYVGVNAAVGPRILAVICNENGTELSSNYCAGPLNYQMFGAKIVNTIHGAIDNAIHLRGSSLHSSQIVGIVVAMPGFNDRGRQESLSKQLKERWLFGDVALTVLPDVEVIMNALAPYGSALVISAGDRDNEVGRNSAGVNYKTYGSGSGPTLAQDAIDAVIGAIKEEREPTTLVPRFLDYFKVGQPLDLACEFDFFSQAERTQTLNEILSILADEAAYGDRVALELCSVNASRSAELTKATIRKLRIEREAFPVILTGDFWKIGDPVKRPYMSAVNETAPAAFLVDAGDLAKCAARIAIELYGR